MLPCELSGQAMPEILYGGVNPSDKLAITWVGAEGSRAEGEMNCD
ncbi:hypothetical protein PR001_g31678 [Phytophthora rubi]|uniref:Uncharacterized protein n=1 Tax=Phytophthora rubi TaxID=129364 RepID=A0A6A3GJH1_9STRA|nr:hypothetical protein PR001_g31678 [Phytophthora rubi]